MRVRKIIKMDLNGERRFGATVGFPWWKLFSEPPGMVFGFFDFLKSSNG